MVKFTTKKIESLTLGEQLKKMREERRVSLNEISRATQIQVKYLECLEEGNYKRLPADVYVRGFLRSYAVFMGIDEHALIKQYEREKGIQKNIRKDLDEPQIKKPLEISNFVFTPKVLFGLGGVLVVLLGLVYLYREVNSFVSAPRLAILKPAESATIEGSTVQITGVAEKEALVFINDQGVLVNDKGEFGEIITLNPGINQIQIKARNKFDKEAVRQLTINSVQQATPEFSLENIGNSVQADVSENFSLELSTLSATWLSLETDGELVFSGVLNPGENKQFEVKSRAVISAAKGNATFFKINGNAQQALDQSPALVKGLEIRKTGKVVVENK